MSPQKFYPDLRNRNHRRFHMLEKTPENDALVAEARAILQYQQNTAAREKGKENAAEVSTAATLRAALKLYNAMGGLNSEGKVES